MEETAMERQHDEQVRAYREKLLSVLRGRAGCRRDDRSESFQVFVNQESIGVLDGRRNDISRISVSRERVIHTVEIRSESGELVGGICLQEFDRKTARFQIGGSAFDLSVHNRPDGSTVRVTLQTTSCAWARIPSLWTAVVARWGIGRTPSPSYVPRTMVWSRAGAVAQVVLAGAVLFLAAERIMDDMSGAKYVMSEEMLARQERMLTALMKVQAEVKQIVQVQQVQLNAAAADRVELHDQVQRMKAANEAYSREIAQLQTRAVVTEAKLANQVQPFKFWVSFQEGTPQERIDQWVKDIHGRKGPTNAGWYPVEVKLSKPQTSDELLESLKKTRIVKAITTDPNARLTTR
jgi:hypothetical protein